MAHLITLQEMFLVSYSILFGIMLNTCMGLGLFFFGWIWDKERIFNKKPLIRALVSLFFINFVPFVYFALIYHWLGTITNDPTFFQIIGTFSLSLFVFGIYRVFHLIIKIFRENLYGNEIKGKEYQKVRNRLDAIGPSIKGHLFAILFYIVIALIGASWIKGNQAFHDLYEWFILLRARALLDLIGILIGFIGSLLLLTEPIRLKFEDGRPLILTGEGEQEKYELRLKIRKIGIWLISICFLLQALSLFL